MKTPDEIAREIISNITVHFVDFDLPSINETALANAIAAALTVERERTDAMAEARDMMGNKWAAEREAREKAGAELKEWKDSSASWKRECGKWRVLADDMSEKATEARRYREAAIANARADALREAAAPYGQNPTSLFTGVSVEATLLRLIDKDAP